MKNNKVYLLIGFIICFIFVMSLMTADMSDEISYIFSKVIFKVGSFSGNMRYNVEDINHIVRKFAHYTEYMILMVVTYSVLIKNLKNDLKTFVLCIIIVVCVSGIDELIIQRVFASGRSGQLYDIMIDSTGAFIGYVNIKIHKVITRFV